MIHSVDLILDSYAPRPPWRPTRERNMEMALLFSTLKLHTYYTLVHVFQSYVQLKIYVLYILNTEFLKKKDLTFFGRPHPLNFTTPLTTLLS